MSCFLAQWSEKNQILFDSKIDFLSINKLIHWVWTEFYVHWSTIKTGFNLQDWSSKCFFSYLISDSLYFCTGSRAVLCILCWHLDSWSAPSLNCRCDFMMYTFTLQLPLSKKNFNQCCSLSAAAPACAALSHSVSVIHAFWFILHLIMWLTHSLCSPKQNNECLLTLKHVVAAAALWWQ